MLYSVDPHATRMMASAHVLGKPHFQAREVELFNTERAVPGTQLPADFTVPDYLNKLQAVNSTLPGSRLLPTV